MIKNLLINALGAGRLPAFLHKALKRRGITILAYHGVLDHSLPFADWCFLDKAEFERQIRYLSQNFKIVHLSEAMQLLKQGKVDQPTAVITFDDGYQNNYDVAFPVLKKYKAPATIYLVADPINTEDTIWFCRLNQALADTKSKQFTWNGMQFNLSGAQSKAQASARIQASLKGMVNNRLNQEVDRLIRLLGSDPEQPVPDHSAYRLLNQAEINEMQDSGLITFGAHTCSHAILSRLSEDEQRREINDSKSAIEQIAGKPCTHFAYPNGSTQDHDPVTAELIKAAGFESCVNMRPGANLPETDPMHLWRYGIGSDTTFNRFKLMTHHIR
ncbi:MAG: polysaccharide deacetylase family protein [Pontibacterium sp.]